MLLGSSDASPARWQLPARLPGSGWGGGEGASPKFPKTMGTLLGDAIRIVEKKMEATIWA